MKKRLMAWLLACLVWLSQEGAKAGGDDAAPVTPLPVARIGPSFACPTPGDPLGRLICENPSLARSDLTFVQAYQALRQASSPQQQALLRNEATAFGRAVRTRCGLLPPAAAIPPAASQCVAAAYEQQRAGWVARLAGAAAQEAGRAIDEQILLQRDLQVIGLLAPTEPINGVYGGNTRAAILAFQQTMGLPATGLLGDADAEALSHAASRAAPTRPVLRSPWDDFLGEAASVGIAVSVAAADACAVALQIRHPDALAEATRADTHQPVHTGKDDDADGLLRTEILFLRSRFAAHAVHAFYQSQPEAVDRCKFEVTAYTSDVYGRDVPQTLLHFEFDRETYQKVVWARFDPANLPKIALSFEYGVYARPVMQGAE